MTRYERNYRRRVRRQAIAQVDQLANKTVVDGIYALISRAIANDLCRAPYPNYALCSSFNSLAEKQAQDFGASLLTMGVSAFLLSLQPGRR
jgi:hypothetical protein